MIPRIKDFQKINDQIEELSDRLELTDETLRPIALLLRKAAQELRDATYNKAGL
jgi:hypothetical protein